jgi:hypothetical protein
MLVTEGACLLLVHRPTGDAWSRLASLVNLLEKLEYQKTVLVTGPREGQ